MRGKLALMEDFIKKIVEVIIDKEKSDEKASEKLVSAAQTRQKIQDAVKLLERGKHILTSYYQEQANITQAR